MIAKTSSSCFSPKNTNQQKSQQNISPLMSLGKNWQPCLSLCRSGTSFSAGPQSRCGVWWVCKVQDLQCKCWLLHKVIVYIHCFQYIYIYIKTQTGEVDEWYTEQQDLPCQTFRYRLRRLVLNSSLEIEEAFRLLPKVRASRVLESWKSLQWLQV